MFLKAKSRTAWSRGLKYLALVAGSVAAFFCFINTAIAQQVTGEPSDIKEAQCFHHKRTTFVTFYSNENLWCAMNNPADCIEDADGAVNLACAYSRSRGAPFVANLDAVKDSILGKGVANGELVSEKIASEEVIDSNQKLQEELISLQKRLGTLRDRQSELEKREADLRQRLRNIEGGF